MGQGTDLVSKCRKGKRCPRLDHHRTATYVLDDSGCSTESFGNHRKFYHFFGMVKEFLVSFVQFSFKVEQNFKHNFQVSFPICSSDKMRMYKKLCRNISVFSPPTNQAPTAPLDALGGKLWLRLLPMQLQLTRDYVSSKIENSLVRCERAIYRD